MMNAMSTELHYSRSPLTEAVIDIRVELPDDISLEILSGIQSGQEALYPTRRDHFFIEGQLSIDPDQPPASATRSHRGYTFSSEDGRHVLQINLDGFAFSRLAPYDNWESFRGEARRLWQIYRSVTRPKSVTRLAVRYINHLNLPLPVNDFKEYLRTTPEVSPDLPQGLSNYFMQLQIPQEDLRALLILNETLLPPQSEDSATVLLDIDIFRDTDVPGDEEGIWSFFEQLRTRKNQVFEACITEHMKELIR
jgi:uncharacterized protein (TIGR04255 family)